MRKTPSPDPDATSTRRIRRAALALLLVPAATVVSTAVASAATQEKQVVEDAALTIEVAQFVDRPATPGSFKVEGLAEKAASGSATLTLALTHEQREALRPGDEVHEPVIGASLIGADGSYEIPLGKNILSEVSGRQMYLTTRDTNGDVIGVVIVDGPSNGHSVLTDTPLDRVRTDTAGLDVLESNALNPALSPDVTDRLVVDVPPMDTSQSTDEFSTDNLAEATDVEAVEPLGLIGAGPLVQAGATRPSRPCDYSFSCCTERYDSEHNPWVTVSTAGTNSNYVDYSVAFESGFSSKLGFAVRADGDGWGVGGGTETTTSSTWSSDWGWKGTKGLHSYKIQAIYKEYHNFCWIWRGWGYGYDEQVDKRIVPSGWTSGNRIEQWLPANSYYPTWCAEMSPGNRITTAHKKSRTFNGGVELSVIRVSARTDSTATDRTVWRNKSTQNPKFACGEYYWPNQNYAGRTMGDWVDR